MRKLSFTGCLLLATIFVYGQKKEMNNAFNFYLNGYLDRAKDAIDKAILNDETAKDAKTWMYRGNIYLRLADAKEKKDREYQNLCKNCAEVAYDAYMKAFELDPKITVGNMGIDNPAQGLKYCAGYLYNDALGFFENKQYEEAHAVLIKANKADESQEYITFLLAYTAEITKKTDVAKTHYNSLIRNKTKDVRAYQYLANIYKSENDTAKVLSTMKAGEAVFLVEIQRDPKNPTKENMQDTLYKNFVIAYSFFLSWADKADEGTELIEKAVGKYPNDHVLLISYGTELSTAKQYAEAEKYLKKALEMQPDEYTAIFNLGVCYYNNYGDIKNSFRDIEDDKEYKRLKDESVRLAEAARPYLEKALQIDPKDKSTMLMLKNIYLQLNLTEEFNAIDEKINALGK